MSGGLALIIAFTDVLSADHFHPNEPHIVAPEASPFMALLAGFFLMQLGIATVGLLVTYRTAAPRRLRRETSFVLAVMGLVLAAGTIYWAALLTDRFHELPHELADGLLVLAAILLVQAVIRHGLIVGKPLPASHLFYTILSIGAGLAAFYFSLTIDAWLMNFTHFPYPIATGILVLVLAGLLPDINRRTHKLLDPRLFKSGQQQDALVDHLVDALAESSDLEHLQANLLGSLCTALGVRDGYFAVASANAYRSGQYSVQLVQGETGVQPGDVISVPRLPKTGAILITAFVPPQIHTEAPWRNIELVCPISLGPHQRGILALGEKSNGDSYAAGELALCHSVARRLEMVVNYQGHQRTPLTPLSGTHEAKVEPDSGSTANAEVPLVINILGPLQVYKNRRLVSEADWGSEKAKVLLAYLLWKNPVGATRAEISEVLWPDRPLDETANVFHVTLHRLRRVLQAAPAGKQADGYIQCQRKHYKFNTSLPHQLDAAAFQKGCRSECLTEVQAAITLYRGSYLEGLTWSLPSEVEIQRRYFERMYIDALRKLAAQPDWHEVAGYLEKLLMIEPTDELAQSALVTGYLARGRRDLAQQQVVRWQQALSECDGEPSPAALAIWQKVNGKN